MKKFIALLLAAVMLLTVSGCGGKSDSDFDPVKEWGSSVINFYNWGEYIGEDVIKNFEKKYNCTVKSSYFDSNESAYTSMATGTSYDVVVPSDYLIERLIKENMIQPIDKSIVTNLDLLAEGVRNMDCDPDNTYMVPYFWGSVGIVYDTRYVDPAEVEEKGFAIFQDPKYAGHTYMYDSQRDAFMMALKSLGYSMNTTDEKEIQEAYEWLRIVDKNTQPEYVTDECIDGMITELKWMSLVYSGDAAYICSENENMAYFEPKEGTNIWMDGMVIPANAKNVKGANAFIKYMLDYDASLDNSETVGYASSNAEVLAELSSEGGDYYGIDAYLPRVGYEKDENFHHNEVLIKMLVDLWNKVKLHN